MIKEFVLLALIQVPPMEEAVFELQPVGYFETMRECQLSRKVKLVSKEAPSYQCVKRSFE
jgi:hypothetical protein